MLKGSHFRQHVVAAKARLAEERDKIYQRHKSGSPGIQVTGALADLFDTTVLDLYEAALADVETSSKRPLRSLIALVPHGGFGRRDVAPYSDVDLMILHHPSAATRVSDFAKRLFTDLGDVGLKVGNSVRTPKQACLLARREAEVCTSLIESRYLAGSVRLYTRFAHRFFSQTRRHSRRLASAIEKARRSERHQYGETVYLLRPNVKRSPGTLRDLQLLRWIGFARYGIAEPDRLQLRGILTPEDNRSLRKAREFLLHLRNEMHFLAGQPADMLDRGDQLRIAEDFGFEGTDAQSPVEQFMQEYFRRTNDVRNIVARFVTGARTKSSWTRAFAPLFSHRLERDYRVGPLQISATSSGRDRLRGDLAGILRLAHLACQYNKGIAYETTEAILESIDDVPDELAPEVATQFLALLKQTTRLGEMLRLLHKTRALEKTIPHFKRARNLLQFNEYHQYTVDEHSLRAVTAATDFFHEKSELGRVYRKIKKKEILHLALLIHDLGKGQVGDHSVVGQGMAEETACRLGLSAGDTESVKFLVRRHLLMSHLAFRRDTSDEQAVVQFSVEVGSPELLRMLFVMTAADFTAVGPDVWNSWKADVLTDLYTRTMQHLTGDGPASRSSQWLEKKRDDIRAQLQREVDVDWFAPQVKALPAAYLMNAPPSQIADELRELKVLPPDRATAQGRYLPKSKTVEYTVGAHENITPGIFHKLTGAVTGQGLQILSAEIYTLADGLVLDRFCVNDPDHQGCPTADRIAGVCHALIRRVEQPDEEFQHRRHVWQLGPTPESAALSAMPTRVRTDNNTSRAATILDIFTADKPGLLYAITHAIFQLGLSVHLAKIATYLDQVVDVFYVTDAEGRKIESEDRLQEICDRLLSAIDTFE